MPNGTWISCWKCKVNYFLPAALYEAAQASENINFFCPYGHSAHYPARETEGKKLRRERDLLRQRVAQRDDELKVERARRKGTERQLSAQKGVTTRLKNRIGHGVCPCCSRSFENLQKHMTTKHPEYTKSDVILVSDTGDGDAG